MEAYCDHIRLWAEELSKWVPDSIFDAHVHLGRPEFMGPMKPERLKEALATFTGLTWEEASSFYKQLYNGKKIAGVIAFPFPFREVDFESANQYMVDLMRADHSVTGFLISDPFDTGRTIGHFEKALEAGARFSGVKPYYDFLGKSNFKTTMPEFIPRELLHFMNSEQLTMMLHTSGIGMSDRDNQDFIRSVLNDFPKIRIILAHMGRYVEPKQFSSFIDCDILHHPNIYLEMSSATDPNVYRQVLEREYLHKKLLFGSDVPYGLITGVEHWSDELGAIFITRGEYAWSDPNLNKKFEDLRLKLTYNTYHAIKALKDAITSMKFGIEREQELKQNIFLTNAQHCISTACKG